MILEEKEHYIEIDIKLSDGTLIGTAEIEPNEKMLERFVIFEPYQNKGYGQQVLSDLIDTYEIKKLWVRSDNERAIHIYEKAGFIKTKETMFEMCRRERSGMNKVYSNSEIGQNIICPYCGKEYDPSYEETYIGGEPVECYKEGSQEFTCDHCGKRFVMYASFTWEYETETIDGEMTEEEWEDMEDKG